MKEFHCRYCEKPISMLTRLTGDKEFCSKEHRQIYLREHSQAALARLIEVEEQDDRKRNRSKAKAGDRIIPLPDPPRTDVAPPPMAAPLVLAVSGERGRDEVRATTQPRWRPMLTRPAVERMQEELDLTGSGAFLYREPAIAPAEFPWGSDRKRIRAVTFPRIAPRMKYLEECLRRTDRLGFSPP